MTQLVKTKITYFGFGFNDKIIFLKLCQINGSGAGVLQHALGVIGHKHLIIVMCFRGYSDSLHLLVVGKKI